MTERELFECVRQEAKRFGWLMYHTYDSRRSGEGFPDLVLARGERLMFRELKATGGRVSPKQKDWLYALLGARQDVEVWREADWPDRILEVLQR